MLAISLDSALQSMLTRMLGTYGFCWIDNAIVSANLATMRTEAERQIHTLRRAEQEDGEGLRYKASMSGLGPNASAFFGSPSVTTLLETLFGQSFALTEDRSCVTHYGAGDYLGPHRDEPAEECKVTVIAYLEATRRGPEGQKTGLVLRVYGEDEPSGHEPRLVIPTRTGTIVIGRGSVIWHERPWLQPTEKVLALTGCYHRA